MAWTKVGETTFNIQDNSTNQDVSLPGSPQEGDVVIFAHSSDGAVSPGVQTSGYTDLLTDHAATNPGRESGYKVMGATPDTIITIQQATGNEYTAGVLQVWRGLDTGTPIDDTPTTATGSPGMPDPPSFDTVTDAALVIAIGFLDDDNAASGSSAPSGYSNHLANDNSSFPPDNATTLIASFEKASAGTENPGAFGGGGSDEWAAVTFALRPSGVSDLSISVSDSISASDSASAQVETPGIRTISVSDAISLSETVTALLPELHISVSDTISASDTAVVGQPSELDISVSDSISVDEYHLPVLAGVNTYVQEYFRIRSDDSAGLNADSGWAAAENTNVTIGTGVEFRLRVKVREAAGGTASDGFKLQVSRNGGAWADVSLHTSNPVAAVVATDSAQFADGDATSVELLTSIATYINGEGFEDNTSASYSLTNEETELEWCLKIMGFFTGPTQNVADDTLEFRVVESDGTALTAYTNPTVTVSETAGYIGGTFSETPNRIGPFADTNGNLYFIIEPATTDAKFMMIKSTNRGDTWREMDGANRPSTNDLECVDVEQAGDTLYIAHHADSSVRYHEFRMSDHSTNPDTWATTDDLVASITGPANQQGCAIARRSDGDKIIFYNRDEGGQEELYYKIDTGGGWGGENTLENEASYDWGFVTCVVGANDLTHIFYKGSGATTGPIYHRSLSSADSLSGRETVDSDAGNGNTYRAGLVPPVYWDSSGNEKIMVAFNDATDDLLYSVVVTNDGTPEARKQISGNTVEDSPPGSGSKQVVANLANDGSAVYAHYARRDPDFDIYRDQAVNDGGWGTDVEEQDAVSCHWIRGTVFTHSSGNGGRTVIGYVWDDGSAGGTGYIRYDEHVIALNVSENESVTVADVPTVSVEEVAGVLSILVTESIGISDSTGELLPLLFASRADSVTVAEVVNLLLPELNITLSDGIAIAEVASLLITELHVPAADAIAVAESINLTLAHQISVSDAISVTDVVNLLVTELHISSADALSVAESINLMLAHQISVGDSVTLVDVISLLITELKVSVADALGVAESINLTLAYQISASDSITVADVANLLIAELHVSVADAIDVAEAVILLLPELHASVSDAISLSDTPGVSVGVAGGIELSVADSLTIADAVSILLPELHANLSDGITVVEALALLITELHIVASDAVTLAEATTLLLPELFMSVSDSVGVSDVPGLLLPELFRALADSIMVTDNPIVQIEVEGVLQLSVSDGVSVSDTPGLNLPALFLSRSESISISDVAAALLPELFVSRADALGVSDSATLSVAAIGALLVQAAEAVAVSDTASLLLAELLVSRAESISLSDNVLMLLPELQLTRADSINVSDSVQMSALLVALVALSLRARSFGLTLEDRSMDLTIVDRPFGLTLEER